jgi:hypothetical protein
MLKQARHLRAFYFSELCDIAAIPMCDARYYRELKTQHQGNMAKAPVPAASPTPRTPLDGDTAKHAVMTLFYNLKRRA